MTKQDLKKLIKEVIQESMNVASIDLRAYDVYIFNNYYDGKYADYSAKRYIVLASSPEEAKQVVLNNADAILKSFLTKKLTSGRNILSPKHALPITTNQIGKIDDSSKKSRATTYGYVRVFSPNGPVMVKLKDGVVEDIKPLGGAVSENYEDGIKDAKERMAYLSLRKQEKDYINKSKRSSSPIKKQHYLDMSKQILDKALDILKKHKVID
jgi:hypothetical protein